MIIRLTTLYKISCAIFTTYYTVIMMVYPSTRGFLLPIGGLMVVLLFFSILETNPPYKDVFSVPITSWIIFTGIELFSSFVVAVDVPFATRSLLSFFELVIMCMCLAYVAVVDRNADFLIRLMYFDSLLYVYFMISTGKQIGGRMALVNANADANVCLIGIVAGSLLITKNSRIIRYLILLAMIPMVYANLMTGSRKSFYCMAFYIVFWIIAELRTTWKSLSGLEKAGIMCLGALFVFLFTKFGIPFFYSSNTYMRMTDSYVIKSDSGRVSLYKEAWQHFVKNPIFGIGFNQFRLFNKRGIYSHSTYAEILACGGITGVIFFFIPHIWMVVKLISIIRWESSYESKKKSLQMLIYVASSLILAAGMVQTSNERVLMMYGMVFGYISAKEKVRELGMVKYQW